MTEGDARRRTWLTMLVRVIAALLIGFAIVAFAAAVFSFFTLGPDSGAAGVVMVDALFGGFVLFVAGRFLWIYAVKKERRGAIET